MKFQGAIVKRQGTLFAIVEVSREIIDSQTESAEALRFFAKPFPGLQMLLMARDAEGTPRYRGPADLIRLSADLAVSELPWREYSVQ